MLRKDFLLTLMLWSLMSLSVFSAILEIETIQGVPYPISQNLEVDLKRFSMRVDKRIELLTAVQLFTSWIGTGIQKEVFQYKQDMFNFFKPFSSHKAVTLCENLIRSGFSYDAPVGFMMHLSNPPELNVAIPYSKYHIMRAGGVDKLEEFVRALRSFCLESNFEEFWSSHQDFYDNIERLAYDNIPLESTIGILEDYFGVKQDGYHVILAPLFWGNYGYQIKVNDSFDIYAFLGPQRIAGENPVFGAALFHEFAHSFINPLTDEFLDAYKNPERLYKPIGNQMMAMAYGSWVTMINEHIIRAVEIKVFNKTEQLSYEEMRGFIYIRPLFDLLSKYNRDSYKSFREFYPEIVNLFNTIDVPPTPFIETPLGIATISGGIIAITMATILIALRRRKT